MRKLSDTFMYDLQNPEGILNPILSRVKRDQTLMLAIRDGFINIYYRGGNIMQVTSSKRESYRPFFDQNYAKSGQQLPTLPSIICNPEDSKLWIHSFPELKTIMDDYYSSTGKSEREFQQLVARENNFSTISNASEYFISDIEVKEIDSGARFDMMAIRWQATKRRSGSNCRVAFIEMKYGDNTLSGKAGLVKHLKDFDSLITNQDRYLKLVNVIENQFNQLDQLGLLSFNKGAGFTKIQLSADEKPEVIFILANHNPRATGLKAILTTEEVGQYQESKLFDLRFFVANFAGYGLHSKCMLTLPEFLARL